MNKKLFISVPMNGYTEDEIDKMINYLKDTAEAYFGESFDVLETHRFVRVPKNAKNDRIYMLGDSIKQYLSKADYYIGITDKDCVDYLIRGCAVENLVWKIYYPNEGNALFCDYSIMCKNLKIKKRKAAKRKAGK